MDVAATAARTGAHAVFATARYPHAQLVAGQVGTGPASLVHAKTMGTMTTLCGESAFSWFKFWDLAFVNVRVDRCPRCMSALQNGLADGDRW